MSDPTPAPEPAGAPPIMVAASSVVTNPVWSSTAVLLGFAGGFLVKAGLVSNAELSVLVPAVMTVALAIWRGVVSHDRAKKALVMADAAPNNVAQVR